MREAINNFLFLTAVVLQTITGLAPVLYREPKRKLESKFKFGGKLKRKYGDIL